MESFTSLGRKIYDMSNPREVRRCVVFVTRSWLHYNRMKKIDAFQISERKQHLEWLKSIQALLIELDVTEELDCDAVSTEDDGLLRVLVESVLGNKYVVFDGFNYCPLNIICPVKFF